MSKKRADETPSKKFKRMIDLYESGRTLEEVGRGFGGISRERVRQIFEKIGCKRRGQTVSEKVSASRKSSGAKRRKKLPHPVLEKMYSEQRQSAKKIAAFFGCGAPQVLKNLTDYGIPIRSFTEPMRTRIKNPELTEEALKRDYIVENKTAAEIAREYDYAAIMVKRKLSKFGIKKFAKSDNAKPNK